MAKKECGNGHIYDADIHESCPYCKNPKGTIVFPANRTDPPTILPPGGGTVMPGRMDIPATLPAGGGTIVPDRPIRPQPQEVTCTPSEETLSVYQQLRGFEPTAGWLIGLGGTMIGRSCELRTRNNRIGRGEAMDVRIPDDLTVSLEDHASIDYDVMHDVCTLIPCRFVNTVYLNGEAVYAARQLNAYDRILFGRTEMMFIPFCGENFHWPLEEESAESSEAPDDAPNDDATPPPAVSLKKSAFPDEEGEHPRQGPDDALTSRT